MKLQFWGATKTVTGSLHYVETNGRRFILDCGLYQGHRKEADSINRNIPVKNLEGLDYLFLSHAHIDHSGNIPTLVKSGFRGKIVTTKATADLIATMLIDSAHIQEKDIEYVNKKRKKHGLPPKEPLYIKEDVEKALKHLEPINYDEWFELSPKVKVIFYDAGHILGSAVILIETIEEGKKKRLLFTGDLGRKGLAIIKDPHQVNNVDFLITESTYGGRYHRPIGEVSKELKSIINKVYERKGKIIIPAFSVGRTQEIVYEIEKLYERKELPNMPIFVDSPLSVNVTEIFKNHPECYDKETLAIIRNNENPFGFGRLTYIKDVEESKRLNNIDKPCIIISASGMCEAGRILHHLKNSIEDERNVILIVGYQAEGTLGRALVEKKKVVRIFGEEYKRRANVVVMNEFSSHGDRKDLLEYAKNTGAQKIFCVHGELRQIEQLASGLKEFINTEVNIPDRGDVFEL
ncbi:MAG: MBL fold metallo-hydrolase [Candidatus Cloacimonas sp. 4484_209]|nr:MAG: MBL fold metallo-hydrolase [Candidatus Cloacimonas sp. 4484_209]